MTRPRSRYIPRRRVSLSTQRAHMVRRWPEFACELRRGKLVCRGIVQPTQLSERYVTRIEMLDGDLPRIFVESPNLEPRTGIQRIPHTYGPNRPCMYHPTEWSRDRILALTVVPWTYRWLYMYENWRVTGEWDAFGIHPRLDDDIRTTSRPRALPRAVRSSRRKR